MANTGPMQILQDISDKNEDKLWPKSTEKLDNNSGNRARIFNDISKEDSNKITLSEQQFKSIEQIIKGIEFPLQTTTVDTVINKFHEIAKEITEDENWPVFWKNIQEKHGLSDEEIKIRQGDVINGYRMKIFSMAQFKLEQETKNQIIEATKNKTDITGPKNAQNKILLAKDLILKINIADRDAKDIKPFDYIADSYKEKMGANILSKFEINAILKGAIQSREKGISDEAIEDIVSKQLEKKWEDIINTPVGSPNGDKFIQLYGNDKGKEIFDQLFNPQIIMQKAKQYEALSKQLGFDPIERIHYIEGLTGSKNDISQEDRNKISDYTAQLKDMIYYPVKEVKKNSDLLASPSMENYYKVNKPFEEVMHKYSLQAGKTNDFEMLTKYAQIGVVSNKTTQGYKRSFGQALRDGFKDFPSNLGNLFRAPPRTVLQIAALNGEIAIESMINTRQEKLNKIQEEKQKIAPDIIEKLDSVIQHENKENNQVDIGNLLNTKPSVLNASVQDDPEVLDEILIEAMENYCANIHDEKIASSPLEQFKNAIDSLAKRGCPSAIFIKAQALKGNDEVVSQMMAGAYVPKLYEKNEIEASKEFKKLKQDDRFAVHPNKSESKMSYQDVMSYEKTQPTTAKRVETKNSK